MSTRRRQRKSVSTAAPDDRSTTRGAAGEGDVERLRVAQSARDQLLHDAEVGFWRYDPDMETYYFGSELSLGHTGIGAPVPLAALQLLQHRDDQAKDTEIRDRLTREGGAAESEMRYLNAGGGWTHLRVRYRTGQRLPSGRYEMYGLSQSVTRLAEARDAARANSQRLGLALKALRGGVFEYDFGKQSFWISPELSELIGPQPDESWQANPLALFHPDDRASLAAFRKQVVRGEAIAPIDLRLARQDGEIWVRLCMEVEVGQDGRAGRGVGLVMDIDESKRQELQLIEARLTAEAATAARSNFLASVSHEIRTPMNGVVGVLNLLRAEQLSDQGQNLLGEAINCSDMLAQLINDVLDFSRIEAGKLELSPTTTDPMEVVVAVANLMRTQAQAKGLYLRLAGESGIGCVSIDSVRLRQCLFNLIGNAVKFTERGGVEVSLSMTGAPAARRLRFEVIDTGIGVAEEARATLFDRFQQADRDVARRFGGAGLGLAITHSLVRMMGGELDFRSRAGEGSTFWFEVPARQVAAATSSDADSFAGDPLAGLLVLVVDDNRVNRLVAVKSLEAMGALAEAVDSGAAAIEAVDRTNFDLVLMDINMPEMDGMQATRRIRALSSQAAATPVIALTADVMSHQRQSYRMAGMDGVLAKPFSPAQLLSEIAKIAERSDADVDAIGRAGGFQP